MTEKIKISDESLIIAAQESLLAFTLLTHPNYQINWHHRRFAHGLERVAKGLCKRLAVFVPPRHGKTELCSLRFPAWCLGNSPNQNIIAGTYNSDFATENSRKVRDIVGMPVYKTIFNASLSKSAKAAGKWFTDKGGYYYSTGIGGGLTGRGANILIIDDPHKDRAAAESEIKRKKVWEWFTSTAYTRLEKNGAIILVMTRWHEDDLAGKLLSQSSEWEVISLSALAERDEEFRNVGEPLWPEKFDKNVLETTRELIGLQDWASLYQQRPVPLEGNIFKLEKWEYYETLPQALLVFQSWDTAFKTGTENDFSVCTTWAICRDGYYLIDRWKRKGDYPTVKNAVMSLYDEFKPSAVLIEDAASGQSIVQDLQKTRLPVHAIRADRDKVSRALAVTGLIAAGKVFLPSGKEWMRDFLDVLSFFPNGKHDDDVDSLTQALNWAKNVNIQTKKTNFSLGR
jgi:predicted phage terminase large subunit-like protein